MADFRTAFPDFPEADMPALPAGFADQSFRNDVCPCFIHEASGLCVWVDYLEADAREIPDAPRFTVMQLTTHLPDAGWQNDENAEHIGSFDDWQAVLDCVLGEAFAEELKRELPAEQWLEVRRRNAADPEHATGSTCHSHDFCDANATMMRAFEALHGREPFFPVDAEAGDCTEAQVGADLAAMTGAWAYAARTHLAKAEA